MRRVRVLHRDREYDNVVNSRGEGCKVLSAYIWISFTIDVERLGSLLKWTSVSNFVRQEASG